MIREANISDCPRIAEIHVFSWRAYRDFISTEFSGSHKDTKAQRTQGGV